MTRRRGASMEHMYSPGVQPLGAVLRYVRRRCAPAHSAAHGPQRLREGSERVIVVRCRCTGAGRSGISVVVGGPVNHHRKGEV